MPYRVLVTGSNGFIGRHLVPELRRNSYEVGCMDIGVDDQGEYNGVIHLAAMSRVSECERDPVRCLETNIMLTAEVIERGFDWMILVGTKEKPVNMYGLSKRFCEEYASLMAEKHGFRLEIIRFPVVYGPGDNENKLIPRIRSGSDLHAGVLPVTTLFIQDAVAEILARIRFIHSQCIVTNEEDLRRVAASY